MVMDAPDKYVGKRVRWYARPLGGRATEGGSEHTVDATYVGSPVDAKAFQYFAVTWKIKGDDGFAALAVAIASGWIHGTIKEFKTISITETGADGISHDRSMRVPLLSTPELEKDTSKASERNVP